MFKQDKLVLVQQISSAAKMRRKILLIIIKIIDETDVKLCITLISLLNHGISTRFYKISTTELVSRFGFPSKQKT